MCLDESRVELVMCQRVKCLDESCVELMMLSR